MIYFGIFIAKLTEVSIATLRSVLATKGYRNIACALSAIEITLWLAVTSTVILGISQDVFKGVAYGVAYVLGVYLGVLLEDKLAIGLSEVEVIAEFETAKQITNMLRGLGYGVTTFECIGLEGNKLSLKVKIKRKDIKPTIKLLQEYKDLFVTITDIKKVSIGNIERVVLENKISNE